MVDLAGVRQIDPPSPPAAGRSPQGRTSQRYSSGIATFTAAVHREEDTYVARCLEAEVASQGGTIGEALSNLREAVELFLEEAGNSGTEPTPLIASFQVDASQLSTAKRDQRAP